MQLHIDKSTEIQISRQDKILFSAGAGKPRVEVAEGRVGNFDCTPYESKSLEWGYSAELHQYEGRLWVVVMESEHTVEVIDREWVSKTHNERSVYTSDDGGETWVAVTDPSPTFDESTLLDRVTSSQ